jgi:hypothetical protein
MDGLFGGIDPEFIFTERMKRNMCPDALKGLATWAKDQSKNNVIQEGFKMPVGLALEHAQVKADAFAEEGDEVIDVAYCKYCGLSPCFSVKQYSHIFVEFASDLEEDGLSNKEIRHRLYRECTRVWKGYLGYGKRIKLPKCIEGEIRDHYPEPEGKYVGFKASDAAEVEVIDVDAIAAAGSPLVTPKTKKAKKNKTDNDDDDDGLQPPPPMYEDAMRISTKPKKMEEEKIAMAL